jgi:hypothetical protein
VDVADGIVDRIGISRGDIDLIHCDYHFTEC